MLKAGTKRGRLDEALLERGLVSPRGLDEALSFQRNFGGSLLQAVLKLGLAREQDLLDAAADVLGFDQLGNLSVTEPQISDLSTTIEWLKLPPEWLIAREAVIWFSPTISPGRETGPDPDTVLFVLARDPINPRLQEELERRFAGQINWVLGPNRIIDALLSSLSLEAEHAQASETGENLSRLRELAEEAPVIEFVNSLFSDALELNASDVHIEAGATSFDTRFRVDGIMSHARRHPKALFDSVSTRIKILSGMDISERRKPQDGRQGIRVSGEELDLRVSTLPARHGESIVMRLLRKKSALPNMTGLGLTGRVLKELESLVRVPNGVILVTGPTGSGKSTTIYRALEQLNDGKTKIITIEDPVEYEIAGVNQVQTHAEIGLTFANGLRSILRQDPDIIMIGEIRDNETALIAIQSALTGHLVLSTLHTNSAIGVVERLKDLHVEPFLMAAALRGAIGQRLLRRLCARCKLPESDAQRRARALSYLARENPALLSEIGGDFCMAKGCPECGQSGYEGRVGVFEVINFMTLERDDPSTEFVERSKLTNLRRHGFVSMLEDGLIKAAQGQTSLEELERVFGAFGAS